MNGERDYTKGIGWMFNALYNLICCWKEFRAALTRRRHTDRPSEQKPGFKVFLWYKVSNKFNKLALIVHKTWPVLDTWTQSRLYKVFNHRSEKREMFCSSLSTACWRALHNEDDLWCGQACCNYRFRTSRAAARPPHTPASSVRPRAEINLNLQLVNRQVFVQVRLFLRLKR